MPPRLQVPLIFVFYLFAHTAAAQSARPEESSVVRLGASHAREPQEGDFVVGTEDTVIPLIWVAPGTKTVIAFDDTIDAKSLDVGATKPRFRMLKAAGEFLIVEPLIDFAPGEQIVATIAYSSQQVAPARVHFVLSSHPNRVHTFYQITRRREDVTSLSAENQRLREQRLENAPMAIVSSGALTSTVQDASARGIDFPVVLDNLRVEKVLTYASADWVILEVTVFNPAGQQAWSLGGTKVVLPEGRPLVVTATHMKRKVIAPNTAGNIRIQIARPPSGGSRLNVEMRDGSGKRHIRLPGLEL